MDFFRTLNGGNIAEALYEFTGLYFRKDRIIPRPEHLCRQSGRFLESLTLNALSGELRVDRGEIFSAIALVVSFAHDTIPFKIKHCLNDITPQGDDVRMRMLDVMFFEFKIGLQQRLEHLIGVTIPH